MRGIKILRPTDRRPGVPMNLDHKDWWRFPKELRLSFYPDAALPCRGVQRAFPLAGRENLRRLWHGGADEQRSRACWAEESLLEVDRSPSGKETKNAGQ